jgi:hypothetical protein
MTIDDKRGEGLVDDAHPSELAGAASRSRMRGASRG